MAKIAFIGLGHMGGGNGAKPRQGGALRSMRSISSRRRSRELAKRSAAARRFGRRCRQGCGRRHHHAPRQRSMSAAVFHDDGCRAECESRRTLLIDCSTIGVAERPGRRRVVFQSSGASILRRRACWWQAESPPLPVVLLSLGGRRERRGSSSERRHFLEPMAKAVIHGRLAAPEPGQPM